MKNTVEAKSGTSVGTPFDDVFRTLLEKCSKLIIPVINEVFHTHYSMEEKVSLFHNEHPYVETDGSSGKRTTDSCIGISDRIYHIECQSRPDSIMEIRMVEYDFHIALSHKEQEEGVETLRFPESAVLYLRHNENTPEQLHVRLILPNRKEADYYVPVVKVQKYTKEEIFNHNLLFFIPYYILKFESELKRIDSNPEELNGLKEEYYDIYSRLSRLEEMKVIDGEYLHNLVSLTGRLLAVVARDTENVKREVSIMGGQVLELESERILERGKAEGRVEGKAEEKATNIYNLMNYYEISFEKACSILVVPKEEIGKYRDMVAKLTEEQEEKRIVKKKR